MFALLNGQLTTQDFSSTFFPSLRSGYAKTKTNERASIWMIKLMIVMNRVWANLGIPLELRKNYLNKPCDWLYLGKPGY